MSTVKVKTNLDLHGSLTFLEVNDFPAKPRPGESCFKGGVLYLYSQIGGVMTWYPTNRPQSSYVHSQGVESLTWTIKHKLGTRDVIVAVYDEAGATLYASVEIVDADTVQVSLTEALTGHAVVFGTASISAPVINAQTIDTQALLVQGRAVAIGEDVAAGFEQADARSSEIEMAMATGFESAAKKSGEIETAMNSGFEQLTRAFNDGAAAINAVGSSG